MASQLTDAFARKFYYLRLSITDVCNFRCTYCLPDGYKPSGVTNKGFLTVDEIRRVTRAFARLGTEKVRLTGGEPSLRRDFTDILALGQNIAKTKAKGRGKSRPIVEPDNVPMDMSPKALQQKIHELEGLMMQHAQNLEFEEAAQIRDQLHQLRELFIAAS